MNSIQRNRLVRRVLIIEGASDVLLLLVKLVVGLQTGSIAILGDAVHSLTDLANNVIGLLLLRVATAPPDREHPYGHHKYETLAVFAIAMVITAMALQVAFRALTRAPAPVAADDTALLLMLAVLCVNVVFTAWERRQAEKLDSDLLRADSGHTLADVGVTVSVIIGWQAAAHGYYWLDNAFALTVSAFVLGLAYALFRRSVPVLVDRIVVEPEALEATVRAVPGVATVKRVRSHQAGSESFIDVVVTVRRDLSTGDSHAIADAIETVVRQRFQGTGVSVHVEPDGN
jgi:cation diffusion facilitator family transporter